MQYRHPVKRRQGETGFILLFVFLLAASLALSLYIEMPRQAFESQRMREDMLVDRGMEYRRAIQLYVRKKKTYPPNLDALEKDGTLRFLRRRYKDPMTGKDEWRLIHIGPNGEFTDSLVVKPKGAKKEGWTNSFISEGPQMGASNQPTGPAAGNVVNRDQQRGLAAQGMPAPGAEGQGQPNQPNYNEVSGAGGYFQGPPQPGMNPAQANPQQPFNPQQPQPYNPQQYNPQQYNPQQYNPQQQAQQPYNPNPQGLPFQPVAPLSPQQIQQMQQGQTGQPGTFPSTYPTAVGQGGMTYPSTYPTAAGQGMTYPSTYPTAVGQPGFNPAAPYGPAGGNMQRNPGYGTQTPASSQTGGVVPQANPYGQAQGGYNTGYGAGMTFGPQQGQPAGPGQNPISINPQVAAGIMQNLTRPSTTGGAGTGFSTGFGAGIAGIASKYEAEGIKLINERSLIHEWEFLYDAARDTAMTSSSVNLNTSATPGTTSGFSSNPGFGSGSNSTTSGGLGGGSTFGGTKK